LSYIAQEVYLFHRNHSGNEIKNLVARGQTKGKLYIHPPPTILFAGGGGAPDLP